MQVGCIPERDVVGSFVQCQLVGRSTGPRGIMATQMYTLPEFETGALRSVVPVLGPCWKRWTPTYVKTFWTVKRARRICR